MVVSLGPGKFYGRSLPRPRIYTDVKFNVERVDPPVPVTDPFMSWANEAHWSMGGLSFKRLRLQGRIEGNVSKLRHEHEKLMKKQKNGVSAGNRSDLHESTSQNVSASKRASSISPPPAPVAFKKRKFMVDEEESEEEEEIGSGDENELIDGSCSRGLRRNLVKNLGDDFDRVASEVQEVNRSDSRNLRKKGSPFSDGSETVALRTRSRKLEEPNDFVIVMKVVEEVNNSNSKGKKLKAGKKSNNQVEESPNSVSSVRSSPRLANRRSG